MVINKIGVWGELYAVRYLRDNGYKIVTGNYRRRVGEIDIVAKKDGVLCFVEVKTRSEDPMFRPYEAVDFSKQTKIRLTAQLFLENYKKEKDIRFDIIEVTLDKKFDVIEINHIKAAF